MKFQRKTSNFNSDRAIVKNQNKIIFPQDQHKPIRIKAKKNSNKPKHSKFSSSRENLTVTTNKGVVEMSKVAKNVKTLGYSSPSLIVKQKKRVNMDKMRSSYKSSQFSVNSPRNLNKSANRSRDVSSIHNFKGASNQQIRSSVKKATLNMNTSNSEIQSQFSKNHRSQKKSIQINLPDQGNTDETPRLGAKLAKGFTPKANLVIPGIGGSDNSSSGENSYISERGDSPIKARN